MATFTRQQVEAAIFTFDKCTRDGARHSVEAVLAGNWVTAEEMPQFQRGVEIYQQAYLVSDGTEQKAQRKAPDSAIVKEAGIDSVGIPFTLYWGLVARQDKD